MKHEKMFKRDLARVQTPAIEKILPDAEAKQTKRAPRAKKRVGVVIMATALLCCLIVGVAAAPTVMPIIMEKLNAPTVKENVKQLTVVPENYTGIYTKEEFLALNDIGVKHQTHYILMNDIEFTDEDYASGGILENGFKPIDLGTFAAKTNEMLKFNGNGHVIRNLKINADNDFSRIGLFSEVNTVINLGLEDCEINVKYAPESIKSKHYRYIGAIAGVAKFVGACYVDGLRINVEFDLSNTAFDENIDQYDSLKVNYSPIQFDIGGIVGGTTYVDSCYATNSEIVIKGIGNECTDLNVGGLAGTAGSCVTSYFAGNVAVEATKFGNVGVDDISVTTIADFVPQLMSEEAFEQFKQRLEQKFNSVESQEVGFRYKVFQAYYLKKDLNELQTDRAKYEVSIVLENASELNGGVIDMENIGVWYLLDPVASPQEIARLADIMLEAFDGDEAALIDFFMQHNAKCGKMYCYTLDVSKALNSADLEGFDFENIWTFRDGKPVQQVFVH